MPRRLLRTKAAIERRRKYISAPVRKFLGAKTQAQARAKHNRAFDSSRGFAMPVEDIRASMEQKTFKN